MVFPVNRHERHCLVGIAGLLDLREQCAIASRRPTRDRPCGENVRYEGRRDYVGEFY